MSLISSSKVSAGTCYSSPTGPYCYAVLRWLGNVTGGASAIYVVPNQDVGLYSVHLNNEMWLIQIGGGNQSLEIGYQAYNGSLYYFAEENFADGTFHFSQGPYIPDGDFGGVIQVLIEQTSWGAWYIKGVSNQASFEGYSNLQFTPSIMDIGEESQNTNPGTIGYPVSWNGNVYIQGGLGHYQFEDGTPQPQGQPPYGHWQQPPSQSSTGGTWIACMSGC